MEGFRNFGMLDPTGAAAAPSGSIGSGPGIGIGPGWWLIN